MGDDLAAMLGASFQVTQRPNNPDAPHPRFSQYKSKGYGEFNQKERQKNFLQNQKQRRFDFLQHMRRLADNTGWDAQDEEEEVEMEVQAARKPGRRYKDQLLLSEWMLEVPPGFEEEWLMVPCPVGKRCLVVASQGYTKVYHRNGIRMNAFLSSLPGGSKTRKQWKSTCTILDCVYVEAAQTYFILDLMCWKDHPIYDSETEFRFYWAATKLNEEAPEVRTITKGNPYKFELLPHFPCTKASLEAVMADPMTHKLDGVLFYHKRTHYTFGPSPLVLWLKAYMMPELLGVSVPDGLLQEMPQSYQNFAHHVETVDREEYSRTKEWTRSPRKPKMEMEIAPEGQTEGSSSQTERRNKGRRFKKKAMMDTTPAEDEEEKIEDNISEPNILANGESPVDHQSKSCENNGDTMEAQSENGSAKTHESTLGENTDNMT